MAHELVPSFYHPPQPVARPRYFAIIVKATDEASLGNVLTAPTDLGNHMLERQADLLPAGARITRAIEISEDLAQRTW